MKTTAVNHNNRGGEEGCKRGGGPTIRFSPLLKKSVGGLLRGMNERSCARQTALPEGQGMTGSVDDWFSRTGPTGLRYMSNNC